MKVFMDTDGLKYMAEQAKSPATDCECPFISAAGMAILAVATIPMSDGDLAAAMQIASDHPEVLDQQAEEPGNAS